MESFKEKWLHQKLKFRAALAAAFDYAAFYFLYWMASKNLFPELDKNWSFVMVLAALWGINVLMIISAAKATFGMMLFGLRFHRADGQDVTVKQAVGVILTSPFWLSFGLLLLFSLIARVDNLYEQYNAVTLFFASWALQVSIYKLIFGSVLAARKSFTGLDVVRDEEKLIKSEVKFSKKSKFSLNISKTLLNIRWIVSKPASVLIIIASLYLSFMVISDLFKQPEFKERLYAPYALDWGQGNSFFALEGLDAPANAEDFYEWGRSSAYQTFLEIEKAKESIGGQASFDRFSVNDFIVTERGNSLAFVKGGYVEDLKQNIASNQILWDRFNKLPDYKNYQAVPIATSSGFSGDGFIHLGKLKAADILRMQQEEQSDAALQEWVRYMNFYRRISEPKSEVGSKQAYMVNFDVQVQLLEKILYNDPSLAIHYLPLIEQTLNPRGLSMFRGRTIFTDNFGDIDASYQYGSMRLPIGTATGVRNKLYGCVVAIDKLSERTPKEYLANKDLPIECNYLYPSSSYNLLKNMITITGNLYTNSFYLFVGRHMDASMELVSEMYIIDARMRMSVLGARLLNGNIPANAIDAYLKTTPPELQNPITESPFVWNSQEKYLYFVNPINGEQMKFRLKM